MDRFPNNLFHNHCKGEKMKKLLKIKAVLIITLFMSAAVCQAGKSSVEYGQKLFNDPALGGSANEKSCASCHPGGEGLENAGGNKKLSKMINRCITGPLKGEKVDGRSAEMRSLKLFIQSLGK